MNLTNFAIDPHRFEIRYPSLSSHGRELAFPCDAEGHVDIDGLTVRACANYLFARAMVGRDYALPSVCSAR